MKPMPDQNHCEVIYEVDDSVYLKLQPYRQTTITFCSFLKLALQYFGLYEVLARVGHVAYKLGFPADSQNHDVFLISLLKIKLQLATPIFSTLPLLSRMIRKGNYHPKIEILVQRKRAPRNERIGGNS